MLPFFLGYATLTKIRVYKDVHTCLILSNLHGKTLKSSECLTIFLLRMNLIQASNLVLQNIHCSTSLPVQITNVKFKKIFCRLNWNRISNYFKFTVKALQSLFKKIGQSRPLFVYFVFST